MTLEAAGWATRLGIAKEGTWNSPESCSEAPAFKSEGLGESIEFALDESMTGDAGYSEGFRGNKSYDGAIPFVARYGELDLFLLAALGGFTWTDDTGNDLHNYQFSLANAMAYSLTNAFNKIVDPWEYSGIKVNQIIMRGEAGGPIEFEFDLVAGGLLVGDSNVDSGNTKANINLCSRLGYKVMMMNHLTFSFATMDDAAKAAEDAYCIRKFELTLNNNLRTDAFTNCDSIVEQIRNAWRDVTLTVDFATYDSRMVYGTGALDFKSYFQDNTDLQACLDFQNKGALNTDTHTFTINIGKMRVEDFDPAIGGPAAIEPSVTFRVLRANGEGGWAGVSLTEELEIDCVTDRAVDPSTDITKPHYVSAAQTGYTEKIIVITMNENIAYNVDQATTKAKIFQGAAATGPFTTLADLDEVVVTGSAASIITITLNAAFTDDPTYFQVALDAVKDGTDNTNASFVTDGIAVIT